MKLNKLKRVALLAVAFCLSVAFTACDESYSVSFSVDNTIISSVETKGNETIALPQEPQKENYIFKGWFFDKDVFTKEFTSESFLTKAFTENITVYAKFEEDYNSDRLNLTINDFEKNQDSFFKAEDNGVTSLDLSQKIRIDVKSSWILAKDSNFTQLLNDKIAQLQLGLNTYYIKVTDNLENSKVYTVNIHRNRIFTVSFDTDGATSIESKRVEENTFITAPTGLEKEGFTFAGWDFNFLTAVTNDITIKALWTVNQNTISFINGDETKTQNIASFETASLSLNSFVKVGYSFLGWATAIDGEVAFADGSVYTMGTDTNYNLYAIWKDTAVPVITFEDKLLIAFDGVVTLPTVDVVDNSNSDINISYSVTLSDEVVEILTEGNSRTFVGVAGSNYVYKVTATDNAGNSATKQVLIYVKEANEGLIADFSEDYGYRITNSSNKNVTATFDSQKKANESSKGSLAINIPASDAGSTTMVYIDQLYSKEHFESLLAKGYLDITMKMFVDIGDCKAFYVVPLGSQGPYDYKITSENGDVFDSKNASTAIWFATGNKFSQKWVEITFSLESYINNYANSMKVFSLWHHNNGKDADVNVYLDSIYAVKNLDIVVAEDTTKLFATETTIDLNEYFSIPLANGLSYVIKNGENTYITRDTNLVVANGIYNISIISTSKNIRVNSQTLSLEVLDIPEGKELIINDFTNTDGFAPKYYSTTDLNTKLDSTFVNSTTTFNSTEKFSSSSAGSVQFDHYSNSTSHSLVKINVNPTYSVEYYKLLLAQGHTTINVRVKFVFNAATSGGPTIYYFNNPSHEEGTKFWRIVNRATGVNYVPVDSTVNLWYNVSNNAISGHWLDVQLKLSDFIANYDEDGVTLFSIRRNSVAEGGTVMSVFVDKINVLEK